MANVRRINLSRTCAEMPSNERQYPQRRLVMVCNLVECPRHQQATAQLVRVLSWSISEDSFGSCRYSKAGT